MEAKSQTTAPRRFTDEFPSVVLTEKDRGKSPWNNYGINNNEVRLYETGRMRLEKKGA